MNRGTYHLFHGELWNRGEIQGHPWNGVESMG